MADEFEIIDNPDLLPDAVSTGYQLQNTGMVSARAGVDHTAVTGGTGECTLSISGPVDVNGVMYTCNSAETFTLTTEGKYYIHLVGSGDNLTPTISTDANTYDADKNARYTDADGYRVLNWVIFYDGTTAYVHRLTNPINDTNDYDDVGSPEEYWITASGSWTAKRTKYYTFWMTGQGGESTVGTTSYGGASSGTGQVRKYVTAGTTWTASFSTTAGGDLSFSDGTTTLIVENANGRLTVDSPTGMDNYISGAYGSNASPYQGGGSFYGGGGTSYQKAGRVYGSGAGTDGITAYDGKSGVIRIIG